MPRARTTLPSPEIRHGHISYRRCFFPSGFPDSGELETAAARYVGSGIRPYRCAVCGTEIDTRTPHYANTSVAVDRVHIWCVEEKS